MATFTAIFVKCVNKRLKAFADRIIDEMRSEQTKCIVRFRKGTEWLALHEIWSHGPKLASRLSRKNQTDSIYLDAQSVVDFHHYMHFVGGARRRELKYCPESGGWLTAFGKPEPWEREILFAGQIGELEDLRQQLAKAANPEERGKIEAEIAAYRENKIVLGQMSPFFKIPQVGAAFCLPGFSLEGRLDTKTKKSWWTFELQL